MKKNKRKPPVKRQIGPSPMVDVILGYVRETIDSGEFEGRFDKLPGFRRLVQVTSPWAGEMLLPIFKRWLLSGAPARKAWAVKVLVARHDAWSNALLAEGATCDDKTVRMAVIRGLGAGRPSTSIPLLIRAESDADPGVRDLAVQIQRFFPTEIAMFKKDREPGHGQPPKRRKGTSSRLPQRYIPDRDEQYPA